MSYRKVLRIEQNTTDGQLLTLFCYSRKIKIIVGWVSLCSTQQRQDFRVLGFVPDAVGNAIPKYGWMESLPQFY
jgi:hypothetical protein